MTAGTGEYGFAVYIDGCSTSSDLQCGSGSSTEPEGSGSTEFEYYAEDVGDGDHAIPSDDRSCASLHGEYNECDDLSASYYIHVFRKTSAYSCQEYTLSITNGAW
jgi:hypothetical protein